LSICGGSTQPFPGKASPVDYESSKGKAFSLGNVVRQLTALSILRRYRNGKGFREVRFRLPIPSAPRIKNPCQSIYPYFSVCISVKKDTPRCQKWGEFRRRRGKCRRYDMWLHLALAATRRSEPCLSQQALYCLRRYQMKSRSFPYGFTDQRAI
jgi:hypothetical protein